MGYVKVVKNKQYYKRFVVKFRRRRQNKTNYRLRRRLVTQDKRKYNTPKWRLVVRITNNDVICQIASARMVGDRIICAAYSHELKRYGLKVGLTNYAACYCTGLLVARRLLQKLGLDKAYPGKKQIDGNMFKSRVENAVAASKFPTGRILRPFKCILDVGLRRCTTGAKIFAGLKGAVYGGLDIPHSNVRFPGFVKSEGDGAKDEYHAEEHKKKIFGGHVSDYMSKLKEENADKYARHFSQYIAEGVEPDQLEDLYRKVHANIRKNPASAPKKPIDSKEIKNKWPKAPRISIEERKERRNKKLEQMMIAAKNAASNKNQQEDVEMSENDD